MARPNFSGNQWPITSAETNTSIVDGFLRELITAEHGTEYYIGAAGPSDAYFEDIGGEATVTTVLADSDFEILLSGDGLEASLFKV